MKLEGECKLIDVKRKRKKLDVSDVLLADVIHTYVQRKIEMNE